VYTAFKHAYKQIKAVRAKHVIEIYRIVQENLLYKTVCTVKH